MNSGGNDRQHISRRAALTGTALALGAAAATVVTAAMAQVKISQATANYQETPKSDQHCEGCANFQPPNACKFVEGHISPNGWCQLFVKKT
jgi:High potential iron-sulfur protein